MAGLFDMAIDHFWRAQQANDQIECASQMANGLQLFCAAVQESTGSQNPYFPMAIDHFWRAQQLGMSGDSLNCLSQMANGLQQFCAALTPPT
jgi:hypothetical protein